MLTNRDIIVFSDDWGRHPSSCQHIVNCLLPYNRVLWVNTIGMRSPQLTLYDVKRSIEVVVNWFASPCDNVQSSLPTNLKVVSPAMIPFNGFPGIRRINRMTVKRTIKKLLAELAMNAPIVITTFPCTCDFVGEFGESVHVYYCVDDFVNWPGVNHRLISSMEDELIARSDLVLASADVLCEAKERNGIRPVLLAHGVDFDHFYAGMTSAECPERLRNVPGPIIGFFGALSAWLDYDLLVDLATQRPSWSFVFIGPIDTDVSMLADISNIHLVGKVSYDMLPVYAACFTVGIIPFKVNELTKSVNPLKLMEYLSLGIPVVSTYMPEVAKYAEIVAVARNHQEFLAFIDNILERDTEDHKRKRLETARAHSWSAVAEKFSSLVIEIEAAAKANPLAVGGRPR